jgi:hypothetical protein
MYYLQLLGSNHTHLNVLTAVILLLNKMNLGIGRNKHMTYVKWEFCGGAGLKAAGI